MCREERGGGGEGERRVGNEQADLQGEREKGNRLGTVDVGGGFISGVDRVLDHLGDRKGVDGGSGGRRGQLVK
jgi:hypothetical protein